MPVFLRCLAIFGAYLENFQRINETTFFHRLNYVGYVGSSVKYVSKQVVLV